MSTKSGTISQPISKGVPKGMATEVTSTLSQNHSPMTTERPKTTRSRRRSGKPRNTERGDRDARPDADAAHARRPHFVVLMDEIEFRGGGAVERVFPGIFFPCLVCVKIVRNGGGVKQAAWEVKRGPGG